MKYLDKALIQYTLSKNTDIRVKNKIKLSEDIKIKKVAFDIYRIESNKSIKDHYDGLWKLEDISGEPYLVRASDPQYVTDIHSDRSWSATSSYDNSNIILSYKDIPVANFTSSEYGYNVDSVSIFKEALLDKVSSDNEFTSDIFSIQNSEKKDALVVTFPELREYLKG